jgi:hypothetical protein
MKPFPFKPGQLVAWTGISRDRTPSPVGLFLVLKPAPNDSLWLLTLQKAVHSDTVGEVRSDYNEDYLPIEKVQ